MFILSTSIYVLIQTSGLIDTFHYKIHEIFNFVSVHGTHTLHYIRLHNANKAAHSGFETQRRHHQKSKTGVPVTTKKDMCPPKTLTF